MDEDDEEGVMRTFTRRMRISPAMVVAFIALGVALGGTSYAVTRLPERSVGKKQLKRQSVTRAAIAANAITSGKVVNEALTGADINEATLGQVPSAAAADRVTEAQHALSSAQVDKIVYRSATQTVRAGRAPSEGGTGATGDFERFGECVAEAAIGTDSARAKGCAGELQLPNVTSAVADALRERVPATDRATAICDAGQHVVGGGVRVDTPESMTVVDTHPDQGGRAWTARVRNEDADSGHDFTVYAICVASITTG